MIKFGDYNTDAVELLFSNGDKIIGDKDVNEFIILCCEQYNKGYMKALNKHLTKAFITGVAIGITGLCIDSVIRSKKKSKELKGEEA